MSDIEERVRGALEARAGVTGIRTMPPGTHRRIRSRQAGASAVALAAVAAFSFVAFELFSSPLGGSRPPQSSGSPTAQPKSDVEIVPAPNEPDGSPAWNLVDPPVPGEWPEVTHGDLSEAYVDRTVGEEDSLLVDKTVIDAGRVQGEPWTLVALEQNGGGLWFEAAPGPCGELFLGSWGVDGGASFCLRLEDMEGSPEMTSTGIVWGVGPITAYAGVVTSRVDRVEIVLGRGDVRRVPLLDGLRGVTGRYFAVFVPNGARGEVLAYDPSGEVVGREQLCAATFEVQADATGACGNGLLSPSSPVVGGP
jgi:hypothetical protein